MPFKREEHLKRCWLAVIRATSRGQFDPSGLPQDLCQGMHLVLPLLAPQSLLLSSRSPIEERDSGAVPLTWVGGVGV